MDADALPDGLRRGGISHAVCVRELPGVYPDGAGAAVQRHGTGGRGHQSGGSCGGREPVFLHDAAYRAADGGGEADRGRPAEHGEKNFLKNFFESLKKMIFVLNKNIKSVF